MTIFSSYNIFESYTQPEDIFWFEARFTLPHSLYDIHFGIWRKLFWETPFFFKKKLQIRYYFINTVLKDQLNDFLTYFLDNQFSFTMLTFIL